MVDAPDIVAEWWSGDSNGQPLYTRIRKASIDQLQAALDALPEYDGPPVVTAPDKAPPRAADLPEVQALRAALQDDKTAFDTIERWTRALTMATQAQGKRPLEWSADDVAARCIAQARDEGGNYWSTLEAVRRFWAWHPDRPYIEAQEARLQAFLRLVVDAEHNS